jgi:antitoxin VapB
MPRNIMDTAVEKLAEEVAAMTGESKTEAIRRALLERRDRLRYRTGHVDRRERIRTFLEREIWRRAPKKQPARKLTKREREAIFGYDPDV